MNDQERIAKLEAMVTDLTNKLNQVLRPDSYVFDRPIIPGPNGLKIATTITQKIGFYGKAPIVQWNSSPGSQDLVDNTGVAANVGFRATGGVGTRGYSLGDIITFLKTRGDIASI